MYQPGMHRLFVVEPAVFDSASKFWVSGDPGVVRLPTLLGHAAAATGRAGINVIRKVPISATTTDR